jgi:hypothetical protein
VLLATSVDKKDVKNELPPVSIVDPIEAERKRAVGLLEKETSRTGKRSVKGKIASAKQVIDITKNGTRREKGSAGRKRSAKVVKIDKTPKRKKLANRAKDIFD